MITLKNLNTNNKIRYFNYRNMNLENPCTLNVIVHYNIELYGQKIGILSGF